MNIIDAFQSGKKVRRKGWKDWWRPDDLVRKRRLALTAILADDWEVENPAVKTRHEQFNPAWDKVTEYRHLSNVQEALWKELKR